MNSTYSNSTIFIWWILQSSRLMHIKIISPATSIIQLIHLLWIQTLTFINLSDVLWASLLLNELSTCSLNPVLVLSVCHRSRFLVLFWDAVNKCCSTSCGGKSLMMTIVNAEQLIEFPPGNLPRESLKAVLKAVTVETSITGVSQSADF